jgi:hypothetical protein
MTYPTPNEVECSLRRVAAELGDTTAVPVRVGMVPVYGGKPPLYTFVILSADREPLRRKLGQVLNRSFSLGASSFVLKADEAQLILDQGGENQ